MCANLRKIAVLILGLWLLPSVFAEDISKVAARVDEHYNRLKSLKADFEETYEGAGLSRKESGELRLLKPGKMRWDYTQPRSKLFVTDSRNAYFYVPGDVQARRIPVKKLEDFRSPIRFLLGHTKLKKEFADLTFSSQAPVSPGNMVLQGIPENMKERVSRVLLEVTPAGVITRIFIEELDGSTTDFRFGGIQEDVPVNAELFKFKAPAGVQVIDTLDTPQ